MQKVRTLRNRIIAAGFFAMLLLLVPARAHAASKEIIELQTQVQQLLDMVQRLQSTVDSRFGVLQNLAQTTADNATQMNAAVNALQQKIAAQNEGVNGKLEAASGQTQALNDSVDELKSRIAKLDKSIQDLQTQLQNVQNLPSPFRLPARRRRSKKPFRREYATTTRQNTMSRLANFRMCCTSIRWTIWPGRRTTTWARSPTSTTSSPMR
jgi:chromosome segregation ATPase